MGLAIERLGVFRCRGYRCLESEGWTYAFFDGNEEICSLFDLHYAMSPNSYARIQGFGRSMVSDFDLGATVFPGTTRHVRYSDSVKDAFRIVLQGPDLVRFAILGADYAIDVLPSGDGFAFFIDAREVGRLKITVGKPVRHAPKGYEEDFLIEASLHCPLKPEQALAMLFFPVLEFADAKGVTPDQIDSFESTRKFGPAYTLGDAPILNGPTTTCHCFETAAGPSHQYEFRLDERKICEISWGTTPEFPVRICGEGVDWTGEFVRERTLVPGLAHNVTDTATGRMVLRVILGEDFEFSIFMEGEVIDVRWQIDQLLFYRRDVLIAYIARLKDAPIYPDDVGQDASGYNYSVVARQDIDAKPHLAILAFPLLRF